MFVDVVEASVNCYRCGKKTAKTLIARDALKTIRLLCSRCKTIDEDGESKMKKGSLQRRGPLSIVESPHGKVITYSQEVVVICDSKEQVYLANREGLVATLRLDLCRSLVKSPSRLPSQDTSTYSSEEEAGSTPPTEDLGTRLLPRSSKGKE